MCSQIPSFPCTSPLSNSLLETLSSLRAIFRRLFFSPSSFPTFAGGKPHWKPANTFSPNALVWLLTFVGEAAPPLVKPFYCLCGFMISLLLRTFSPLSLGVVVIARTRPFFRFRSLSQHCPPSTALGCAQYPVPPSRILTPPPFSPFWYYNLWLPFSLLA